MKPFPQNPLPEETLLRTAVSNAFQTPPLPDGLQARLAWTAANAAARKGAAQRRSPSARALIGGISAAAITGIVIAAYPPIAGANSLRRIQQAMRDARSAIPLPIVFLPMERAAKNAKSGIRQANGAWSKAMTTPQHVSRSV